MGEQARPRVFVSAVSKELGSYREEVARVLRRKELEVRDQEHFRQGPATLLEQLRDYVEGCDAVVLLVGDRCGAFPTAEHVAALGPVAAFDRYRERTGAAVASYTQWEYLFAQHFGKPYYVWLTGDGFSPDEPNSETAEHKACQAAFREWVKGSGKARDPLTTKRSSMVSPSRSSRPASTWRPGAWVSRRTWSAGGRTANRCSTGSTNG